MDCFLEVWLRGYAKDFLKNISEQISESYHPHITLVRPFIPKTEASHVKESIISVCRGVDPIYFSLQGTGSFNGRVQYVAVTDEKELLSFADRLEEAIAPHVDFAPSLGKKKLHATIEYSQRKIVADEKIEQYMLRMTAIRKKRIWFSHDFVIDKVLDRAKSLDQGMWYDTVQKFTEKTGLLPTPCGFMRAHPTS